MEMLLFKDILDIVNDIVIIIIASSAILTQ